MIYRIIVFLVIVIAAITYIVISKRKYERLLKAEMEEINRRQMERMRVDRGMTTLEVRVVGRGYSRTTNLDDERSLKPNKHIKRHSVR